MTEDTENKVSVIAQKDPFSAQRSHFDFQALRREGLKHIGDLSGKIWTDHNAHDPGITILEELCYALIDLGYRTTLPMQDLLAQPRDDSPTTTEADSSRHENFFTPLEILSCNPTTVLDFRKLLLDIDGVRNAWLEPAETDSPPYLYLQLGIDAGDNGDPKLQCLFEDKFDSQTNPVTLNGLYSILIQKEIDADEALVIESVVETLSAHRNLCEDFSAIRILRPLEVGVCADIDIEETADAATVYEDIIRAVRSYIMPELRYYTLTELLDKGRAIGYDLRLMSVSATTELVNEGHRLVIVAFVGANLHIRIFDTSGEKAVDKAESELVAGDTLTALKQRLTPFPGEASLSRQEKQEIIDSVTSITGHTRAIEDIFAGRPLLRSRSAGFVDTEELEALPFRDELQGSDLYAAVLAVKGVVAVRNLSFQTNGSIEGKTIQRVRVSSGSVAEFSLDRTCVNLQTSQGMLFLDKERIHRRLQEGGKPRRGLEHLDLQIPEGRYRPGLADYYSIQHDFPLVYGIGKGGLPNEAAPLRKVQALQLKGYLLFYDQLLANYLAQIANLRHLFSLQVESKRPDSERHTYFSQDLERVPDRERLFPSHPGKALSNGSILAAPVADDARLAKRLEELRAYPLTELLITDSCEPAPGEIPHFSEASKSLREVRIRQSIRDFHQGDYSLELARDRNGHFFILRFQQTCELVLVSYQRYNNQDEAREAANFAAFLANRPEYYARRLQQVDPEGSQIAYQYNLVYDPAAYTAYLQFLVENEALYLQRRETFLDHLLARFATQFTDYALLRFGAEVEGKSESRQTIEDKSRFLSRVDDLSRDRGRAYDYLQPSWGTENVSGFEKRVSLLAGMQDFRRRHLCKFEVVERFRMEIEDPNGDLWFSSIETYPTREKLGEARQDLVVQLRDPSSYERLRRRTRGFDPVSVGRVFSCVANDENIKPSKWVYALILKDSNGDARRESSKNDYTGESQAWRGLSKFIKEIEDDTGMELVETGPKSRLYIDNRQMQCRIDPIITYKWHRCDFHGEPIASASAPHPSPVSAIEDFAQSGDHGDLIVAKTDVALWSLRPGEGHPPLVSIHAFDNELEAQRAWLRSKSDGQIKERYRQDPEPGGQGTRITLTTEGGVELATAIISEQQDTLSPDEYIEHCQAEFGQDEPNLEFSTLPTAFGWRLAQQGENALFEDGEIMESALLFRDVPGALFGLLDALVAVKDAKNYFEAGTEDNPDYRILLRSSRGPFIATTPSCTDATERSKNLKLVRDRLKQLPPPLEVREEPRRYCWKLCRTIGKQVVLESSKARVFDSEAAVKTDFENIIRRVYKEQPSSPVGQQVYAVDLKKFEDKYRFVYCLNGLSGKALPLLHSAEEYGANEVRGKYADFVTGLPQMQREKGSVRVADTDVPAAVLISDTEGNRSTVDRILEYMQMQYGNTLEENAQPKWIYRLLDRDNPIAKSKESFQKKKDAETALDVTCGFRPCRDYEPCPKKDVVRVICPELDPGKYHYALFLGTKDKERLECATLISYMAYATEGAARSAGEENWLKLIERAADPENYGDDKTIAVKEAYAESTGSACDRAGVHLAVKPEAVETDLAVTLAKCYPIRISYKKDDEGNLTSQVIGFHFQGYDEEKNSSLWRSTVDYSDADQALEAYQLFLTLLGNSESCRIECDEGCYRIHLVEILAESREFDTEAEAWGDMSEVERDDCGRDSCPAQGVRLFAQRATSETAFVPVRDGDCYRFEVVDKGYVLARHTCDYHSRAERDKAKDDLYRWAEDGGADLPHLPDPQVENPTRQEGFLQFHLGKGYFLQSFKALPDLQTSDVQKIVDEWLRLASSSRNYWWNGYDLRLVSANTPIELTDRGTNLMIVAVIGGNLHIRIFDSNGMRVVDIAEVELNAWAPIVDLKKRLDPLPDVSRLSPQDKREVIDRVISISGYTRHEEEIKDKWILGNPKDGNRAKASILRIVEVGEIVVGDFIDLVRAYPVFKQDDGHRFRLYYPQNADRLDEELTICGCREADDSKEQTALSFCDQSYVYESTESYPCRVAAEKAFMRFLDLLAESDNYKDEEETGLGTFSFAIIDPDQVLASHPHSHPDRTSAMRAEERARACVRDEGMHLVEHILLRPDEGHRKCLLPVQPEIVTDGTGKSRSINLCKLEWQEDFDPDDPCAEENNPKLTYVPGSDPYSFWATVVLPSWTERFRNSERRHFFRQMLYREVPAMVGLNIVWLGPRQMYEFEKVLKPWLSSRRLPSALCQDESDHFCCMVKFIGGLCNEPLCPDPDTAAATRDCFANEGMVQYDECIEESESLFWLACESGEIPKTIECEDTYLTEVTDGTEVTESTVVTVDAAAVRKEQNRRTEYYTENLNDIDYKLATSTKSYDRTRHFLTNPATLDAFKLLNAQMVQDISRKGTRKGEVLVKVYQNAFWYLLDHLVQENPKEVPPQAKEALPQLLLAMEAKGVVLDDLAKGWNGEVFGELFGSATTKIVNEYLALINKG